MCKHLYIFFLGNKVMNELDANCVENLSMFKDQADMTSPVAAGHSFGGATTLLALQHEKRYLSYFFLTIQDLLRLNKINHTEQK